MGVVCYLIFGIQFLVTNSKFILVAGRSWGDRTTADVFPSRRLGQLLAGGFKHFYFTLILLEEMILFDLHIFLKGGVFFGGIIYFFLFWELLFFSFCFCLCCFCFYFWCFYFWCFCFWCFCFWCFCFCCFCF